LTVDNKLDSTRSVHGPSSRLFMNDSPNRAYSIFWNDSNFSFQTTGRLSTLHVHKTKTRQTEGKKANRFVNRNNE